MQRLTAELDDSCTSRSNLNHDVLQCSSGRFWMPVRPTAARRGVLTATAAKGSLQDTAPAHMQRGCATRRAVSPPPPPAPPPVRRCWSRCLCVSSSLHSVHVHHPSADLQQGPAHGQLDVAVVGGGPGGLAAAHALLEARCARRLHTLQSIQSTRRFAPAFRALDTVTTV